jgi:hypothetical protein
MYKDTAISWQGGYRNRKGNSEVNESLSWESISRASQNGYKLFELELTVSTFAISKLDFVQTR